MSSGSRRFLPGGDAADVRRPEQVDEPAQQHHEPGQQEREHADRHERLDRPSIGQAGRGVGGLVEGPGALDEVDREPRHDQAVGDGEQEAAEELHPVPGPRAHALAHEVDADMAVLEIDEAHAEQEQHRVQMPFALLELGRAQHQEPPRDHVEQDDHHQRDGDPGAGAADAHHDPRQEFVQGDELLHDDAGSGWPFAQRTPEPRPSRLRRPSLYRRSEL